jgi:DNA-binding CsgD family transcriptional regulator
MQSGINDHATRNHIGGALDKERARLAQQLFDLVARPIAAALREFEPGSPAASPNNPALVGLRDALDVVCALADNLRADGDHAPVRRVSGGTVLLAQGARPTSRGAGHPLSRREIEVLRLAAGALSNAQIAAELFITEGTVKRHLTNIYAKLGAVSRMDAVNKAQAGWLMEDPRAGPGRTADSGSPRTGLLREHL